MWKPCSRMTRGVMPVLLALAIALPGIAQTASSSQVKKSGASASCDGALDIVPSKPMTFVRKRRPSKPESKPQPSPADPKTGQKQPGDSKQGN